MTRTTLGGFRPVALGFGLAIAVFVPFVAHAQETIGEIRVHGNHTTPDADVIGLSGLKPGDAATDARLAEAEQALRKTKRFDDVELRKRFRSIDNPEDILIMIVIDERAGVSADDLTPGFGARVRSSMLWLPIFNYADGYGLTYGIRATFADPIGTDSALSFPFSWGGERRAGVELERSFNDQRTRAGVAFWVNREVNPFFEVPDLRQQVRLEADHAVVPWMRVGAGAWIAARRFWRQLRRAARRRRAAHHVRHAHRSAVSSQCHSRAHRLGARRLRNRERRTMEDRCTRVYRTGLMECCRAARAARAIERAAASGRAGAARRL